MTCQQTNDLLHGYIDGELDLLQSVEIERHFDQCHSCALRRQEQLELRLLIKDHAPYYQAPDLLRKRVQNAIREGDKAEKKFEWKPQRWLAIAAAVAIVGLSTLALWNFVSNSRPKGDDLLAQEVVASHVRSLMANHLTDVLSSDQHTVKPWFDGKLDFAPQVKDLKAQGFELYGGRLDYLNNRTVAALIYQRRKHYINLFIWPAPADKDQSPQSLSRQGYNVVHWTKSGATYWAASDVNIDDLKEFVRLIQE